MDAYERLMKTTDAKGRKLQVYKLPRPPPLFRTFKEANGLAVRLLDCQLMLHLEVVNPILGHVFGRLHAMCQVKREVPVVLGCNQKLSPLD